MLLEGLPLPAPPPPPPGPVPLGLLMPAGFSVVVIGCRPSEFFSLGMFQRGLQGYTHVDGFASGLACIQPDGVVGDNP